MEKEDILKLLKINPKDGGLYRISEKTLKKNFPEIYKEFDLYNFPDDFSTGEKIFHYLNNDINLTIGLCECGKRCKFISTTQGYCSHCSVSCSMKSKDVKEKIKKTNLARYGVENASQSEEIKEKKKNTNYKIRGVESPFQSKDVKEKIKKTNLARYGVKNVSQSEEIKEKRKNTLLKKYGVVNPSQSEEIKEKRKNTFFKRYGVSCTFLIKDVKKKIKNTMVNRYGVEYALQNKQIKEKLKKTNFYKYGVDYTLSSCLIRKKIKETNLKKYGVDNVSKAETIKEKRKNTFLKRYGVVCFSQSKEIQEKIKQTNLKKLGVEYPMQSEEIKRKRDNNCLKKYGVTNPIKLEETKEKARKTNKERYGVDWCCLRNESINYVKNSKTNILFGNKLKENNIAFETEFPLTKYSYDFKIGSILVEINPTITHNSYLNVFGGEPHKSDYHLNKSNTAKENGFHCIHVWDWDDKNKIVEMLKPKKTLYARNLEIKDVDIFTANNFLNRYHLQSTCKGQPVCLGLFLNNELVQLMTFGKPRYNKNYEWELLRLCSHFDYMVVGGSERLFRHFVKTYNPQSVVSYCDLSKFDGGVYVKLGFTKKGISKPTRHWYGKNKHITDNLLRQRGFDQLFGANYGKGTSNEELMLEHGFLPVYDCGQATYVWINE